MAGTTAAEFCAQHALDEMVDVNSKKCRVDDCDKIPSFGVAGTKIVRYCAQQALDGMVNVKRKQCRIEGCRKQPSFGVASTKTAKYCAQHAPVGMVHVKSRKYRTKGCGKHPSFGVADANPAKHCTQHARLQCGVEGCREREVGPHHSGEESIDNVIQSDGKKTVVHPPTLSDGRRSSRKRVRHPEFLSTASKRDVARMSTGAVTMPNIDGEKSTVNRDSSVKTEVQVFL